ncbi:MAG: hypothetical protein K2J80_04155 [Oscillospiraceae bacterium]|nr:hypothetical protein [Oscillospiraceae bacterium]
MKNTNNVPEKRSYTTGEIIAEILCGVLLAAAFAFYIASRSFKETHIVAVMMIMAVVYGALTGFSVYSNFILKLENPHRNRKICMAVKMSLIALLLATLVMKTFHVGLYVDEVALY